MSADAAAPFPNLFQPLALRHLTLRHRLNFGAHTNNGAIEGVPSDRQRGYYEERARGGAAMIVVEPIPVHRTGRLTRGNFNDDESIVPAFRAITEAVHGHGAAILQQLYHVGGHGDWDNSFEPGWSPSGLPSLHDSHGSHMMRDAEVREVIASFANAAERAQRCGFDGIEIMGAYNALFEQFWSPYTNLRDDAWGGTFDKRMAFSRTVLEAIRRACGEDFVIGVCVSVDSARPDVLSLDDQCEIAAWHDAHGLYDYVTVGTGGYFNFPELMPTVLFADKLGAPNAEAVRRAVTHARVQCESHVRTPENADYVIASGQADMVSIVRGQIADPHMANKAREGRAGDIRPCISCNQMCWGRRSRDYWISCLVNPSANREFEWGGDRFTPSETPKRVLVVGGGPAGLEAARVAAERGHRVTLVEAAPDLGGQFRLAGMQPRRGQVADLLAWYERQLQKLQVEVRRNAFMDADEIAAFAADAVIMATGAQPDGAARQRWVAGLERLPGGDGPDVWTIEDVMSRNARIRDDAHVLMLDDIGDWRSLGVAWHLAEKGAKLTIVTPDPFVGRELQRTSSDIPLRARLKTLGATFHTESAVVAWKGDRGVIRSLLDGAEQEASFDALVTATLPAPDRETLDAVAAARDDVTGIGDCVSPRHAPAAIYEGRRVALSL